MNPVINLHHFFPVILAVQTWHQGCTILYFNQKAFLYLINEIYKIYTNFQRWMSNRKCWSPANSINENTHSKANWTPELEWLDKKKSISQSILSTIHLFTLFSIISIYYYCVKIVYLPETKTYSHYLSTNKSILRLRNDFWSL